MPPPKSSAVDPPAVPAPAPRKGRGATFNPENRYAERTREPVDDGWAAADCEAAPHQAQEPAPLLTIVRIQQARTIVSRNDSPDIPFT